MSNTTDLDYKSRSPVSLVTYVCTSTWTVATQVSLTSSQWIYLEAYEWILCDEECERFSVQI